MRGDVDAADAVVELLLAEEQILRHRHRRNQAVFLENHADPELARLERRFRRRLDAFNGHRPRGQGDDARHHFGERRLASAIFTNQRVNLATREVEIDVLDSGNAGVEFGRIAQRQDHVVHAPTPFASSASEILNSRPGPFATAYR